MMAEETNVPEGAQFRGMFKIHGQKKLLDTLCRIGSLTLVTVQGRKYIMID